jgi:hypothetical protein
MIEKSDIITCKSYQPLCDYLYDGPDFEDIPPTGLVHVHLDNIEEFFKRIDSNGHRYVIVSSCSDYGLAIQSEHPPWKDILKWAGMMCGPGLGYQGMQIEARLDPKKCNPKDTYSVKCHSWTRATLPSIPHNVHHWFVGNLMFVPEPETYDFLHEGNMHEKITAIPFGIAEGRQDYIYNAMQKIETEKKKNKIYVSWNDYNLERYELRKELVDWQSYAGVDALTVRYPKEGQDTYEDYIENLRTHKYVVSPPGNGADCYRTLESIYMKCFTFVEDTATNYITNLPVYRYKTVDDIIRCYNDNGLSRMEKGPEEQPETKLSYWSDRIKEKASEMFV